MKGKKLLTMSLMSIMVLAQIPTVSSAQETGADGKNAYLPLAADAALLAEENTEEVAARYITVDLTSSANAVGFGTSETVTEDVTKYMTTNGGKSNIRLLNKTAFDRFKDVDGNISADNGIPFKISTDVSKNNILYLGGYANSTSSITVPMPKGKYSGITFANAGISSHYAKNFVVKVVYEDGTSSKDTSWRQIYGPVSQASQTMGVNTSKISVFGTSDAQKDAENYALYVGKATTYWIPVYEIAADPTKTVKEVVFSGAGQSCAYGIIGVTGIAATDSEAVDILIKRLPDAESVTAENYMDYAGTVKSIERCIDNGAELGENELTSYQAIKEIVDSYSSKYVTVDLTEYANAKGFGNTGVVDDVTNYVTANTVNNIRVFNSSAFEYFKKSDENIYADDGTPFKFSTNKEKNVVYLGGYQGAPTKCEVNIPEGKYSSISFVNGGTNSPYTNITVKVIYKETDPQMENNYTTDEKWTGIMDPTSNKNNLSTIKENIKPTSSVISCFGDNFYDQDTLNTAFIYKYNQSGAWGTKQYVPVYRIETDPQKTITQVVFSGGAKNASYSVLGLTATKAPVEVNETEQQLDSYIERINSLTENEINEAYELLRTGVAQGNTSWDKYSAIVEKKALKGLVTINDVTIENNHFSAVTNIADLNNSYSYVLVLAVYDGNNKLVDAHKIYEANGQSISTNGEAVSYDISTDLSGKTLKCFAWTSFGAMKPIAEMIVR